MFTPIPSSTRTRASASTFLCSDGPDHLHAHRHRLEPDPRGLRPEAYCHYGNLDLLAFWLQRGWLEEEFFPFTGLNRAKHYGR
jgi:hypothetical protein